MGKRMMLIWSVFMFHCDSPAIDNDVQQDIIELSAKIILPHVSGRIDHIAYDPANHLAFVAALGNNSVEVVNIDTRQVVRSIKDLNEPQGIAYIPSLQQIVVANGGNGACTFFDEKTFRQSGSVDLKDDADNIRYDTLSGLLYVGYGSGGISIIDPAGMKQIASIPLDDHPESFQFSKKQNRIYINVPDVNEIEVADLASHSVNAKWKNTVASSNFPMALDEENDRLYVGCRSPATLRVIDAGSGKEIHSVSCSGDADDIFYDAADSLVFVSAGKGFIDIFKAGSSFEKINHIETSPGARTSLLLLSEKKLLLAVPAHSGDPAALWIYTIHRSF